MDSLGPKWVQWVPGPNGPMGPTGPGPKWANGANGSRAKKGPMGLTGPGPKWANGSRAQMGQWAQWVPGPISPMPVNGTTIFECTDIGNCGCDNYKIFMNFFKL